MTTRCKSTVEILLHWNGENLINHLNETEIQLDLVCEEIGAGGKEYNLNDKLIYLKLKLYTEFLYI